ncbi:hypothetical protein B0T22DRAFT_463879 [Podospora appendiculata]|uniref:MHYT domain-containing protein n=1 Tax=Podospora appendiculata TaxID=314037 RepID=A0AAE0XDP8_9PEZI|nr:hypothetical protein B0T22DRAFT_463879 [Podospora appendiculata]
METGLSGYTGQVIPFQFNAGIIVISFVVSFVGSASTLELINRRTSRKGRYNYLLLFGAAISMGGVAIWCMHYIGNRATSLLNGEPELQIAYSVGITALSFFVPILVLVVAFFVVTSSSTAAWWRIGLSGSLSGGAISGMHYLGNASISNYKCSYNAANVAGAVVIAAAASTIALALFFVFRASWANSWWKRIGCALVLAGAVSGMHWCAALGTSFRLVHLNSASDNASRNTTVIVVACLSVGACLVMAGTAIYSARIRRGYASKAQKINLAAAIFDMHGRILVTPDGLLPSEEITSTFLQKTQHDAFSTSHPLFHWVFQASHNWPSITNLIDKMSEHLGTLSPTQHGRKYRARIELVDEDGHFIENYDMIFRELFCLAAAGLAHQMHESLVETGVLWDEIFATGGGIHIDNSPRMKPGEEDLAEKGEAFQGNHRHGSLMFLVRKVETTRAVDKLEALGYCFAELHQVAPIIGSSMQIRNPKLEDKLRAMASYTQDRILDPGVHLGLFAVKARVDNFSFDILVRKGARNLLPSVKLPIDRLEPAHIDLLRRLDGMTLSTALRNLPRAKPSPEEAKFAAVLHSAVSDLHQAVHADPTFDNAKLVARISQAPCGSSTGTGLRTSTCPLIAFSLMIPIHTNVVSADYEFIPLQFFKTQQLVNKNSPNHAAFARSVHREISTMLNTNHPAPSKPAPSPSSHRPRFLILHSRMRWPFRPLHQSATANHTRLQHHDADKLVVSASRDRTAPTDTPSNRSVSSIPFYTTASNDHEHSPVLSSLDGDEIRVVLTNKQQPQPQPRRLSFGGIMVSQEVTVEVEEQPTITSPPSEASNAAQGELSWQESHWAANGEEDRTRATPQEPLFHEQGIELGEVRGVNKLGRGLSRVEVKKEDDVRTFVDDLFASFMDTPKRL